MISKHRLCFHIKQVRSLYALFSVHSKSSVRRLQHIQNVPVRVLTQRSDYITPVSGSLHWLPVQYKMIVLVPKALYGLTSYYIFDLPNCSNQSDHSSNQQQIFQLIVDWDPSVPQFLWSCFLEHFSYWSGHILCTSLVILANF